MKKYFTSFLCLLLIQCSHSQKQIEFDKSLSEMDCDLALQKTPGTSRSERIVDQSETLAKNILAYTYVAANYTAEVTWDVSAGVVLFTAFCLPEIIVMAAASKSSGLSNQWSHAKCITPSKDIDFKTLRAPPLGRKSMQNTQKFRCPNLEGLANSLTQVASCYERKGDPSSLQKAITTLENIEQSKHFYSCLAPETQLGIIQKRQQLQETVATPH